MQPKTTQRLINFRKSNKRMPRRRYDIRVDKVNYKEPEYLSKFTTETGKLFSPDEIVCNGIAVE